MREEGVTVGVIGSSIVSIGETWLLHEKQACYNRDRRNRFSTGEDKVL